MRTIVETEHGELEVAVARHEHAPTFTFDIIAPAGHATVTENGTVISCQNMTRAQLMQHVEQCQTELARKVAHDS